MKIYIFISYGHDVYAEHTQMIYEQLQKDDEDFVIWWDKKLKSSENWVYEIDRHLNELIHNKPDSCFVYVVTPHSANTDRDNFCIKEIAKVIEGRVRVIPVKLVETPMPLLLSNIQWLDFSDTKIDESNDEFMRRIDSLRRIIKDGEALPMDGKQEALRCKLEPCNFSLDLEKHLKNYEPRPWLLDMVRDWIMHSPEQLLLLLGGPGTGKTAFSIWMSYCELSQHVAAWHLCQYNDMRTCSLHNAIKSIAYYLASRIPAYYDLLNVSEIDRTLNNSDIDTGTLFKVLILEKVQRINHDSTVVILIDALDEASRDRHNELAEMLVRYMGQLPGWLKFIVTSRNDSTITTHMADCSTIINLDAASVTDNSLDDIRRYVGNMLGLDSPQVRFVVSESGNNFLYAQLLCSSIQENPQFSSGELPKGINSYYNNYMRRYFNSGKFDFEEHALPLLNLILTAYEPLDKRTVFNRLHDTCPWCTGYSVFQNLVKSFGPLLKESCGCLLPFHKSLFDWFMDNENNYDFSVYRGDGLRELIAWGRDVVGDECPDPDDDIVKHFYRYLPQYMIESNDKSFIGLYIDLDFWKRRQSVIGVSLLLRLMIDELTLCRSHVRKVLFADDRFFNVLNYFNIDLFNTGRYSNLHKLGYVIPLTEGMNDQRRLFAIRYLYINELYREIDRHCAIFMEPYQDHVVEAMLMNELGQTYRKFGRLDLSADFYRKSLDMALKYNGTLDEVIYTMLNLSRIFTLQCRHDEARKLLKEAVDEFDAGRWHDSMQGADFEFSAQQLARGVYYVSLETEMFSLDPDIEVCNKALAWADEVYGDPVRRDRYYPNHLIGKLFFMVRTGRSDHELDSVIGECERSISSRYDGIRMNLVKTLIRLRQGKNREAYDMACENLEYLKTLDIHMIQRAGFAAVADYVIGPDSKSSLLNGELLPWYSHVHSLINQILHI